jgi:glycosyltransferase involved in cell wall biosynthesis
LQVARFGQARIAFVAVSFMRSGTEQVIVDLTGYFARAGHAVTVLIPRLSALDGMVQEVLALGASVERVGPLHSTGHNALRNGHELLAVFRRLQPDIVHFHVPWEPICFESVTAAIARIPVRVRTEHNPAPDPVGLAQRAKMRVQDRAFHKIVYLSEGNRRSHVKNLGRAVAQSVLIGNGIEPASINADRSVSRRRAYRERMALPQEAEIALMVGTLNERKGVIDFVRAAGVAARIHPRMHFALLGDGELRPDCERLAAESGISYRVHFLGHRPDVREILSTFDLFVQSSYFEGMSVAMLEALAAGLPMVTTRVDGVEDLFPAEEGGLYVDTGDWQRLGEAMAELASRPELRKQLAAISQTRVVSQFSVQAMCQRYADLYRALGARI